jgi:hypothetical protein
LILEKGKRTSFRSSVSLNGDCPKRDAPHLHERYDLLCPDLPKVL